MEDEEAVDASTEAEQKAFEELMGKTIPEILEDGQKVLFARLVGKVRAGTASHQQEAILRNILKDNGMIYLGLGGPGKNSPAGAEEADVEQHPLPEFSEPDYDHRH